MSGLVDRKFSFDLLNGGVFRTKRMTALKTLCKRYTCFGSSKTADAFKANGAVRMVANSPANSICHAKSRSFIKPAILFFFLVFSIHAQANDFPSALGNPVTSGETKREASNDQRDCGNPGSGVRDQVYVRGYADRIHFNYLCALLLVLGFITGIAVRGYYTFKSPKSQSNNDGEKK